MKLLRLLVVWACYLVGTTAFLSACKKDKELTEGSVVLEFSNVVGAAPLELSRPASYRTLAGDEFSVTTFRYYISNIKLRRDDGIEFVQPESYYLVDEALPDSKTLTIPNVPAGTYTRLSFVIGVDSARNESGPRTGALAPGDMLWTWDPGYINTKLEGRSAQSTNTAIVFHVVGFKGPNNTVRTVAPSLNGASFTVADGTTPRVQVKADVLKMFSGPNTIRFASLNNVMGGPNARLLADNQAAGMFTIDGVSNK